MTMQERDDDDDDDETLIRSCTGDCLKKGLLKAN